MNEQTFFSIGFQTPIGYHEPSEMELLGLIYRLNLCDMIK